MAGDARGPRPQGKGPKRKGQTVGTGVHGRKALEGKGPTPKAAERPNHKAYKDAKRAQKAQQGKPRRTPRGGDAEWVAGRNSVVELLRAGVPVTGVYLAEGAERGFFQQALRAAHDRIGKLYEQARRDCRKLARRTPSGHPAGKRP